MIGIPVNFRENAVISRENPINWIEILVDLMAIPIKFKENPVISEENPINRTEIPVDLMGIPVNFMQISFKKTENSIKFNGNPVISMENPINLKGNSVSAYLVPDNDVLSHGRIEGARYFIRYLTSTRSGRKSTFIF